jgi:hypothetical protein
VGGFANIRVAAGWLAGLGLDWTSQLDHSSDYTSQLQGFAALQYLLAGQLYIKAVFAYARAYFQPGDDTVSTWTNNMYSGRIRLMYLY